MVFLLGVACNARPLYLLVVRDGILLKWPLELEKLGQQGLWGNFPSRKRENSVSSHRHEKMYKPLSPLPTYHEQVKTCNLVG